MQLYENNSTDLACTLNNLGLCYSKLGEYRKSLKIYKRSKRIYSEVIGK